jgi:hypothetical protein
MAGRMDWNRSVVGKRAVEGSGNLLPSFVILTDGQQRGRAQQARFMFEARQALRIVGKSFRQNLDGNKVEIEFRRGQVLQQKSSHNIS